MSKLLEVKGDLLKSPLIEKPNTMILHCVSADYALGAGVALQIELKYHIRSELKQIGKYSYPDCIATGNILNMVTKGAYWCKPTYDTFKMALELVLEYCKSHNVQILLMPRIGCGLDRLDWKVCKEIIQTYLVDNGIDCVVYTL